MKISYLILVLSLGILLFGCQAPVPTVSVSEHSLKGWALYSWQEGNDWHFVLYPGTNAIKTANEILAAGDKVIGAENLKRELARMPRGEEVIWSTGGKPEFKLPPGEIVVDLAQFCSEHQITLTVAMGQ